MSRSEDDALRKEVQPDDNSTGDNKNYYKCCEKRECKTLFCINCEGTYHRSCAQIKKYQFLNDTQLICCMEISKNKNPISTPVASDVLTMELKINYLVQLLRSSNEKNELLQSFNSFLVKRVENLERQVESNEKKGKQITDKINKQMHERRRNENSITDAHASTVNFQSKTTVIADLKTSKQKPIEFNEKHPLEIAQEMKMKEIIDLNNDTDSDFQTVNRSRKTKRQPKYADIVNKKLESKQKKTKRLGTGNSEGMEEFKGPEKKAWFFINRVNPKVSEKTVENYIRKKEGFENQEVEVKELQFKIKKGDLKSFMVKVPFERKDQLYNTDFWPKNVGIKRFNFSIFNKNRVENNFLE